MFVQDLKYHIYHVYRSVVAFNEFEITIDQCQICSPDSGANNHTSPDDGWAFTSRPIKTPSMLSTTFTKTMFEVRRGNPEPGKWGGVPSSEGEVLRERASPKHLVFVVHGMGESLVSKSGRGKGGLARSAFFLHKSK